LYEAGREALAGIKEIDTAKTEIRVITNENTRSDHTSIYHETKNNKTNIHKSN
jgi:hypothetical protein